MSGPLPAATSHERVPPDEEQQYRGRWTRTTLPGSGEKKPHHVPEANVKKDKEEGSRSFVYVSKDPNVDLKNSDFYETNEKHNNFVLAPQDSNADLNNSNLNAVKGENKNSSKNPNADLNNSDNNEEDAEKGVQDTNNSETTLSDPSPPRTCWAKTKSILFFVGPAWFVAMAYLDPGNLEGDLLAGSARDPNDPHLGYRLLWVVCWATFLGYLLQRLGIKLGTTTGNDLATCCHQEFPRWLCGIIWVGMQLCLIGADMQAVIGSAVAFRLLLNIPMWAGIVITLIDTFIILLVDCFGVRKLELCLGLLISFLGICFFANMFTSKPSWAGIGIGLAVPHIPPGQLQFSVGLVGGIITPHNFFLQSSVVQARPINRSDPKDIKRVIRIYSTETFVVLCICLLINIAVVASFANPSVHAPNGEELDLYNAHLALESALGKTSSVVWGLGLLSAGVCATIASTYCAQFIMEGLLNWRIRRPWLRVLVTRCISLVPVFLLVVLNQTTVESISNFVNVLQAFVFPFVLVLLLKFTCSEKLMGSLALGLYSKIISYAIGLFLVVTNMALVIEKLGHNNVWVYFILVAYIAALGFLWWRPLKPIQSKSTCSTQDSKSAAPNEQDSPLSVQEHQAKV